MAGLKIFVTLVVLMMQDGVLSCTLRHHKSGTSLSWPPAGLDSNSIPTTDVPNKIPSVPAEPSPPKQTPFPAIPADLSIDLQTQLIANALLKHFQWASVPPLPAPFLNLFAPYPQLSRPAPPSDVYNPDELKLFLSHLLSGPAYPAPNSISPERLSSPLLPPIPSPVTTPPDATALLGALSTTVPAAPPAAPLTPSAVASDITPFINEAPAAVPKLAPPTELDAAPVPSAPSVPSTPSIPSVQVAPSVPGVPSVPSVPSAPGEPPVPSVPSVPDVPSVPSIPSVPGEPPVPSVPSVPGEPSVPSVPSVPGGSPVSSVPSASNGVPDTTLASALKR